MADQDPSNAVPGEILTERLRLYAPTLADLEARLEMDQDPEVMRFIMPPRPREEARRLIAERIEAGWPAQGIAFHVAWRPGHEEQEPADAPGFLGWCALWPLEDEPGRDIEIGYRYRRAAWGRGIATEAARAVLACGFERLGFDPIVGVTDHDNRASQKVLAKIGLRRTGNVRAYGEDVAFFVARRADWLAAPR